MKLKIVSLAILAISVLNVSAQSFHFGAKAGANIYKLKGQSFNDQFSFGYHLGGFAEIGIGKKWSIQPEVIFNQVNVDTTDKFNQIYKNFISTKTTQIKLSYLSIPILANYNISKFLSLQAGPQFGILIDQNKDLLVNGKDAFKKGDLSLLAGLQLKFAGFRVYGRYAIGLSNLNDIDNKDEWKSQSIQLGVGIAIF